VVGFGGGGSYTRLPEASKKLLKLIRDYHDVWVCEIWEAILQVPPEHRKGHVIELTYPETVKILKLNPALWEGTVFVDTDENLADINSKMKKMHQEAIQYLQTILQVIKTNIQEYQDSRKANGKWDTDEYLSLEPKIEQGRDVYVKDIFKVLKRDSVEDLARYIDLSYYHSFFFEAKVCDLEGDDYDHNRRDTSALIYCAYHNSHQCMKYILEHKECNPNYQNGGGSTALHIAGRYGYVECVKLLLKNGIDVTLKEKSRTTAYDRCIIRGEAQCAELIKEHCV
jgi:hypothetical protein